MQMTNKFALQLRQTPTRQSLIKLDEIFDPGPRAVRLSGGAYSSEILAGRFHGPNRDGVGGIFTRNRLGGTFGAKRSPGLPVVAGTARLAT